MRNVFSMAPRSISATFSVGGFSVSVHESSMEDLAESIREVFHIPDESAESLSWVELLALANQKYSALCNVVVGLDAEVIPSEEEPKPEGNEPPQEAKPKARSRVKAKPKAEPDPLAEMSAAIDATDSLDSLMKLYKDLVSTPEGKELWPSIKPKFTERKLQLTGK